MDHDSRFDQLVTATEELVHENERVRAKFKAFEAALAIDPRLIGVRAAVMI